MLDPDPFNLIPVRIQIQPHIYMDPDSQKFYGPGRSGSARLAGTILLPGWQYYSSVTRRQKKTPPPTLSAGPPPSWAAGPSPPAFLTHLDKLHLPLCPPDHRLLGLLGLLLQLSRLFLTPLLPPSHPQGKRKFCQKI